MGNNAESALAIFKQRLGTEDGVGDWHKVEQSQINQFADATGDHQFIHVDPEKAAQLSPYKVTIAHGFLTLSIIPYLTASMAREERQTAHSLEAARVPAAGPGPDAETLGEKMGNNAESALAIFKQRLGTEDGVGDWHKVEQSQINQFADATGDHQFIHVDPEKAAQLSPYKVTIAHGFLTLSLIPYLTASIPLRIVSHLLS